MSLAKQKLEHLSQDPTARRQARERAEAIRLYDMHLAASEARGEAKILLKLLAQRFGPPAETIRARIEAATIEQLEAWTDRLLTAASPDEVLAQ